MRDLNSTKHGAGNASGDHCRCAEQKSVVQVKLALRSPTQDHRGYGRQEPYHQSLTLNMEQKSFITYFLENKIHLEKIKQRYFS